MTFDPTTLAWTWYYRASYGAALPNWSHTATAGTSGSNGSLLGFGGSPAGPTIGTAVNGLTPAHYDGVGRYSTNDVGVADTTLFTSTTAMTFVAYVKVNTSPGALTGNVYDDTTLFRNTNSNEGLSFSNSGWTAYAYDGGYKSVSKACATGAYHAIRVKLLSGNLIIKVDSGATSSVACGALTYGGDGLEVAIGYLNTYLNCDVLEIGTMAVAMTDANWTSYLSYLTDTYPALSQINGTSAAVFGQTGTATGAGTLVGTSAALFGQTGTATGAGKLVGTSAAVFSQTGTATGAGTLVGTSAAVFGQTGSAKGAGTLVGTSAAVFGQTGSLAGAGTLAGTVAAAFSQTGTAGGTASCVGTVPVIFSATATGLHGTGSLAGTAAAMFSASLSGGAAVFAIPVIHIYSTVGVTAGLTGMVHTKTRLRSDVATVTGLTSTVGKKLRLRSTVKVIP